MTTPVGDFWDTFVAEHWEKRPGVFRGILGEPLLTSAQAFADVNAAADRFRAGGPALIRFFLEDALLQSRVAKYLPKTEDGTFAAFAKRIEPLLRGGGFGLTINGFAHYDFELFNRVRRFLKGLYERVGLPGEHSDLDVFIGNYRRTPFGIHTDSSSNFSVVFEGQKRLLVWPGDALAKRHELHYAVDYEEVRAEAIVLEGGPGDIIYWPSSYWHIAESDGGLSGVMNVSLYVGDQAQRFVANATAAPPRPATHTTLPWDPRLPAALLEDAPTIPKEEARRALLRAWLGRVTSYNFFRSMPPAQEPTPLTSARVCANTEFPFVTTQQDGFLICSAHGHVIELAAVPKIAAMIERLASGEPCAVEDLVASAVGLAEVNGMRLEVGPDEVGVVLQNLVAMRAIREVP